MKHSAKLIGLCLILAACTSRQDQPIQVEPSYLLTATPVELAASSPTLIPTPQETFIPTTEMPATLQLNHTPTLTLTPAGFKMCSPLAWETIPELFEIVSDPYKPPPVNRAEERHHGVDFSHYARKGRGSIEGEPVQAILAGKVAAAIHDRLPYGNMLIVESEADIMPSELAQAVGMASNQSLYVLYAHMKQSPQVQPGDLVTCGQVLGEVGASGYNVVNAHLHLEIRLGPPGVMFPSMAFYTTTASVEEMETYTRWRTEGEFKHFDPMILFQEYLKLQR